MGVSMSMSDGGKGSSPRPYSVDVETFDDNWDRIFKKDKAPVDKEEGWGDLNLDSDYWNWDD